jgi:hypothetical protein
VFCQKKEKKGCTHLKKENRRGKVKNDSDKLQEKHNAVKGNGYSQLELLVVLLL